MFYIYIMKSLKEIIQEKLQLSKKINKSEEVFNSFIEKCQEKFKYRNTWKWSLYFPYINEYKNKLKDNDYDYTVLPKIYLDYKNDFIDIPKTGNSNIGCVLSILVAGSRSEISAIWVEYLRDDYKTTEYIDSYSVQLSNIKTLAYVVDYETIELLNKYISDKNNTYSAKNLI